MPKLGKGALPPEQIFNEMRPCPFCGQVLVIMEEEYSFGYDRDQEATRYWVQCACGMTGPHFSTSQDPNAKEQALNWGTKRYGQDGFVVKQADFEKDPEKYLAKRKVDNVVIYGEKNKVIMRFNKLTNE